jgi:hypothetical protein
MLITIITVMVIEMAEAKARGITTIPVSRVTRDKLKSLGLKGETYDEIIARLMEIARYEEFMERQYALLKEKDKFVPLDEI